MIERRKSRKIRVGSVEVGGDAPILVQTMTNTLTSDAAATIAQIRQVEEAGCDIVRVSCPDEASTAAMPAIVKASKIPIVADIDRLSIFLQGAIDDIDRPDDACTKAARLSQHYTHDTLPSRGPTPYPA